MPPLPRAVGRIFVMGPPGVGKSFASLLLSYFLNAQIIKTENLEKEYRHNKIARILFEKYPEAFQVNEENIYFNFFYCYCIMYIRKCRPIY